MRIEIDRNDKGHMKCPFLASLHNINQNLKQYSDKYLFSIDDGYIIHVDRKPSIRGDVFSKVESKKDLANIRSQLPDGTILTIIPQALYSALNEFKKELEYIEIGYDNRIVIKIMDRDEGIYIGDAIWESCGDDVADTNKKIQTFLNYHDIVNSATFIPLNEEQVERIAEAIFKCNMGDFHIRLTKQLVPGVSNKMEVSLFLNTDRTIKSTSGELCPLYVKTEKGGITSYLVYNIIKY